MLERRAPENPSGCAKRTELRSLGDESTHLQQCPADEDDEEEDDDDRALASEGSLELKAFKPKAQLPQCD